MPDDIPRPAPPPTHPCPGRCGRAVVDRLFACGRCWVRLPRVHQRAVSSARRGTPEHAEAMIAAAHWYGAQAVNQ